MVRQERVPERLLGAGETAIVEQRDGVAEQGPDAVILSSRRGEEGIEVIAAVDYDEALMAGAARQYSISLAAAALPKAEIVV